MIKDKELISEYFTKYYPINKKYIYNEIDAGTVIENLTGGGMFVIIFLIVMMLLKKSVVLTTATGETLYSEPKYRQYSKNFNSLEEEIRSSGMEENSKKQYLNELSEIKKLQEELKKLKENRDTELNNIFSQLTRDTAQVGDETKQEEMSNLIQEVKKGFIEANIIENLKKLIEIIKNSLYNGKDEIIKKIKAVIASINKEVSILQKLTGFIKNFTLGIFDFLGKANLKEKASSLWGKVKETFGKFFNRKLEDITKEASEGVEADPLFLEVDLLNDKNKIVNTFKEYNQKVNFVFSKNKQLLIYQRDDENIRFYPFKEDNFNNLFSAEDSGLFLDEIKELGSVFINPDPKNDGTPIDIEGFTDDSNDEKSQSIKIKIKLISENDPTIRKIVYINDSGDDPQGFYFNNNDDENKEKNYYLKNFKQEDYLKLIYSYDDYIEVTSITKTIEGDDLIEEEDDISSLEPEEVPRVDTPDEKESLDIKDALTKALNNGDINFIPEALRQSNLIKLEKIFKMSEMDQLNFYDFISKLTSRDDYVSVIKEKQNNLILHFGGFIREANDIVTLSSLKINHKDISIERFIAKETTTKNKFEYTLNETPETNEIFLSNVLKGSYEVDVVRSNSAPSDRNKIKSFKILQPGIIIKQPGVLDKNTKFKVQEFLKIELTYDNDTTKIFEFNKKAKKLDSILLETFFNQINSKKVLLEASTNSDDFFNIIKKDKIIAKLPKLATIEEIKKLKPSNIYLIDLKNNKLQKVDNLTREFLDNNLNDSILLYQKDGENEHTGQLFIDFKSVDKRSPVYTNFLKYFKYEIQQENNAEEEPVSDIERMDAEPVAELSSFIQKKLNKIIINEVDTAALKGKSFAARPVKLQIVDNYLSDFLINVSNINEGSISIGKINKENPEVEEQIEKNKPQTLNNFDVINFFKNNQLKKSTEEFLSLVNQGDKYFLKFSLNLDLLSKINELENFKEMVSKEDFPSSISIDVINEENSYNHIDFEIEVQYDEINKKINITKDNMKQIITKISGTLVKPREISNVIFNFDIMNFFENNELKKSNEEFLSLIEKQKKYFLKFNLDSNILEEINTRSKNFKEMSKENFPSILSLGVITEATNYQSIQFEIEVDYDEQTKEVKISGDKMKEIITKILRTRTFNRDEVFNSYKSEIESSSMSEEDKFNILKNIDYYINNKTLESDLKNELNSIFNNEISNAESVAQLLKNFIIQKFTINSDFYTNLLVFANKNDMKFFNSIKDKIKQKDSSQGNYFLSLEDISQGKSIVSSEFKGKAGIIFKEADVKVQGQKEKLKRCRGALYVPSDQIKFISFNDVKGLNKYFDISIEDVILNESFDFKDLTKDFISDFNLIVSIWKNEVTVEKKGKLNSDKKTDLIAIKKELLKNEIGLKSDDPNYQTKKKTVYDKLGLPFETLSTQKAPETTINKKDSYLYLDLDDIKKNRFLLKYDTIPPTSRGGVIFRQKEQKGDITFYTGVLYVKDLTQIKIEDYNSLELLFNIDKKSYIAEEINIESYRNGIISDESLLVEVDKNKRIKKFVKKGNLITNKNQELIEKLKLEYLGLEDDVKEELAVNTIGETTGIILFKGKRGIKIPKNKGKINQFIKKPGIKLCYYYKTSGFYYFIDITDNDNFTAMLKEISTDGLFKNSQNQTITINRDIIKADMNFFKTIVPFTNENILKTLNYKFGKIEETDVKEIRGNLIFIFPTSITFQPLIELTSEEKKRIEKENTRSDGQVVDNLNETSKGTEMSSFKYNMDFDSIIIERVFKR